MYDEVQENGWPVNIQRKQIMNESVRGELGRFPFLELTEFTCWSSTARVGRPLLTRLASGSPLERPPQASHENRQVPAALSPRNKSETGSIITLLSNH